MPASKQLQALSQKLEVQTAIDKWLQQEKLNEYGDSQGTFYAGGNPLFDMATGNARDRYLYLLQKFPALATKLATQFGD